MLKKDWKREASGRSYKKVKYSQMKWKTVASKSGIVKGSGGRGGGEENVGGKEGKKKLTMNLDFF